MSKKNKHRHQNNPQQQAQAKASKQQQAEAAPASKPNTRIFVPRDAAALSMGANAVAKAIAAEAGKRNAKIEIVRNGSRGMLWLEPFVEVETDKGRVGYGPVAASDVAGLFDADFLKGGEHTLSHGLTDEIPYFKNQERLTFARCGITDPLVDRRLSRTRRLCRAYQSAHHGARRHRGRGHHLRPARPRRRRLPDRNQVEDGLGGQGRPEIHLLQRG